MSLIDILNNSTPREPTQEVGIGGFTALARVNESYEYSSTTPTTFLEDGSSIEDTIILNPLTLTIEGAVGEIYLAPTPLQRITQRVADELGNVAIYLPARTSAQAQKLVALGQRSIDQLRRVDAAIQTGEQLLNLFGGSNEVGKPIQEQFVDAMELLHNSRSIIDISMPFRVHANMRITNVQITKDNKDKAIKFRLDATQIRLRELDLSDEQDFTRAPAEALGGQTQGEANKGIQEGERVNTSLLGVLLGGGG